MCNDFDELTPTNLPQWTKDSPFKASPTGCRPAEYCTHPGMGRGSGIVQSGRMCCYDHPESDPSLY